MAEVLVPYGDDPSETATLLLGAVEELDDVEVFQVRNQPEDGGFRVPEEVAKEAGLKPVDEEQQAADEAEVRRADLEGDDEPESKPAPRKRAAAKKTAAKKTSSK
jgi:hypothetical protein